MLGTLARIINYQSHTKYTFILAMVALTTVHVQFAQAPEVTTQIMAHEYFDW